MGVSPKSGWFITEKSENRMDDLAVPISGTNYMFEKTKNYNNQLQVLIYL